ncbi:MAG: FHA domain-containing protein [Acidimicrobiia bacterium]
MSDPRVMVGRVGVIPGPCLVARTGNGVLVVGPAAPEQVALRDALIECLREVCAASESPGDTLGRRLVGLIVSEPADAVPSFAACAIGRNGVAMLLTAGMEASWLDADGWHPLSGRQSASWLDYVITSPVDRLVLGSEPLMPSDPDPALDLRDGVVPGDSVVIQLVHGAQLPPPVPEADLAAAAPPEPPPLAPEPSSVPPEPPPAPPEARPAQEPAAEPAPVAAPQEPPPLAMTQPRAPMVPDEDFEIVALDGGFEAREPLPVAGEATPSADSTDGSGVVLVNGLMCPRGHFNHPEARFCVSCGIDFNQQGRNLVSGVRPPLGLLVIDDGSAFTLDADYVIGREPDDAAEVVSGAARPLVLVDAERSVSRIHAVLTLSGWEVVVTDRGSANGTYVLVPGAADWVRLGANQSAPLGPGARVAVGRRTFLFESHHVVG